MPTIHTHTNGYFTISGLILRGRLEVVLNMPINFRIITITPCEFLKLFIVIIAWVLATNWTVSISHDIPSRRLSLVYGFESDSSWPDAHPDFSWMHRIWQTITSPRGKDLTTQCIICLSIINVIVNSNTVWHTTDRPTSQSGNIQTSAWLYQRTL